MTRRLTFTSVAIACLLFCASACQRVPVSENASARGSRGAKAETGSPEPSGVYSPPTKLGVLWHLKLRRAAGLFPRAPHRGVYWTHNDSGDGPFLYAFDRSRRT